MAEIIAVCRSDQKGTRKKDVGEGFLRENYGILQDAHADENTHRQVSLIAMESINKMRELGLEVGPGDFAENVTTKGLNLVSLPLGTRISLGENAILEVTQIGKECHTPCAIYHQVGMCIMQQEGVFARVIRSGLIKVGDEVRASSLKR
ncbi:MAG: MOSC domain-containing protein [Dehalococcoidia bacterium]|nr:MOSC domain-containing protein [Dehalococcoidia bacterium]